MKGIVRCFHCLKSRCHFTNSRPAEHNKEAKKAFDLKMETVRYSCGDLVLGDDDPLSNVIVQRQSLHASQKLRRLTTTQQSEH